MTNIAFIGLKNNFYDKNDVKLQRKKFLELAQKNNFEIINTDLDIKNCKQKLINYMNRKLTKYLNNVKI